MLDNREAMHLSTMEGARIQLRPIVKADGARIGVIFSNLQTIHSSTSYGEPSYVGSQRMLDQISNRRSEDCIHFGIWLTQVNKLIGLISFQHWSRVQSKATLGYMLDQTYWNQGTMTEALRILLAFGFDELGLHQVEGRCYKYNIASERVMTKNGLTCVRTLPGRIGTQCPLNAINVFSLSETSYRQYRGE